MSQLAHRPSRAALRLAALLATAAPLAAQTAPAPAEAPAEDIVQLPALTVTGERVERSISETASSVSLTTAAQLEERAGADALDSVFTLTPNILYTGTGNDAPTIRGQDTTGALSGAGAFLSGQLPRATIQLDGRALSANEYVYGVQGLWDVSRVEIFRGPQTTT